MSETENLWKIFESTSKLIRFSDTKAIALLATNGVITSFYLSNINLVKDILAQRSISIFLLMLTVTCLLFCVYFSLRCIFPSLKKNMNCNLVFYQDIVDFHNDANEYEIAIKESFKNTDALQAQLTHAIWAISQIAKDKYFAVSMSIIFFVVALFANMAFILMAI